MSGSFTVPVEERDQVDIKPMSDLPRMNQEVNLPIKEDLGAGLTSIGKAMEEKQIELEKKQRILAVHDMENKVDGIVQSAAERVVSAKGENAFITADQTQKEVKDKIGKLLDSSPGIYRSDFINVANQRINRFDKVAQGHQYREANELADGIYKENASNLTDRMAMSPYGEPGEFDDNLRQLGIVTRQYVQHKLGGEDGNASPTVQRAIEVQVKAAQSTAVMKTIEGLASTKDMPNAEAYANRYAEYLTTADRIKVNGILSKGRENDKMSKAMSLVEEAAGLTEDPVMRREYLSKAFKEGRMDGVEYQHALNALTQRTNFEQKQKDIQDKNDLGSIYKTLAENGGAISPDMYAKVDPKHWPTIGKYAVFTSEGKQIPLDAKYYAKVRDEIEHMTPERARQVNPDEWRAHMPPQYIQRLESLRNGVINNSSSSKDVSDITQNFIKKEILAKPGGKKMKEDMAADLKTLADETYEEVRHAMDPKASKSEIRQRFEEEMALKMRPKDGGHSWWEFWKRDKFEDKHDVEATTLFTSPADKILIQKVREELAAKGQDTSNKNVYQYVTEIKRRAGGSIPIEQLNKIQSPFVKKQAPVQAPVQDTVRQQPMGGVLAPAPRTTTLDTSVPKRNPNSSGDPEIDRAFQFTTSNGRDDFRAFPYQVKYPDGTMGRETVGYGHEVQPGEKFRYPMPESMARELAYKDLKKAKTAVESRLKVKITPEEKTVLTDLAFNLGANHQSLLNTINLFNQGKRKEAHDNIAKIDSSSHGDMAGLSSRAQDRVKHIVDGMKLQKTADGDKNQL